jgi:RNA polymerase sigma factor (sigma-70 family)
VLELRRQSGDDQALIAAFRAGDDAAFGRIHERHHAALERYARKVLSRSSEHAEDVVQEAMLRASRALRRDDRHIELRPWLYRLTRNCALDELARVRTDSVNFDDAEDRGVLRAPEASQPDAVIESRGNVRDLLGDLAGLPAQQRHALLRREVDGISHAALADELGVSPQATKNLVHRARTNLVKQRDARSSDCQGVRADLLEAHDEGRRASAATYRHVATCRDCRHFRAGLRDTRRAAAILMPMPLLVVAFGLLTGKAVAATAKGAMVKSAATATAGVAITAGAVGVGVQVFGPGEPAPQSATSRALPSGELAKGGTVPAGTAIVRKTVTLSGGRAGATTVTLPCPAGLRVADLIGARGASASYARGTVVGVSAVATVLVQPRPGSKVASPVVTVLCKRPDNSGSIVAGTPQGRTANGITLHVTVTRAELFQRPGGAAVGSVRLGQPVRTSGTTRDGWRKVTTDTGETGWLRAGVVG